MDDYIELGSITGFFGVKGWVKLYSHTRPHLGIADYSQFYVGDAKRQIAFTKIQQSGKYLIGHIDGVDSRESAQAFIKQTLFVKREDLPKLDNEYYWHELIGLTVINQQGGEEHLIPYAVAHFVLAIDTDKGEMRVDWELDDDA